MARIPEHFIDEVLARTDIVEVIGKRVPLKKKGREFVACCPFHEEKTPSFYVSPAKQFYHCFGCGAHGSALTFLMEYERMDFRAAVAELAQQAGLAMPRDDNTDRPDPNTPIYDILSKAAAFYAQELVGNREAVHYLKQRGIKASSARLFQLGYASSGNRLLQHLGSSPEVIDLLIRAGLVIQRDDGECYDRFRNRIIFPIRDRRGRVLGFGGRLLGPGEPKYLNSPETPVYQKGQGVYGIYEARQADARPPQLIVVEGYMDVIMLAQAGITNVVATLGTAITAAQIQLLYRISSTLVFCFDGDKAGRKAAWRALEVSLPLLHDGRDIRFVFLPAGEDPDSFVQKHGKIGFEDYVIEQGLSLDSYFLRSLAEEHPGTDAPSLARLAERGRALIRKLPTGTIRTLLTQRLNNHIGLTGRPPSRPTASRNLRKPLPRPVADALDLICAVWLKHPDLAAQADLEPTLTSSNDTAFLEPVRNYFAKGLSEEALRQIPDAQRRTRLKSLKIPGLDDPEQAAAVLEDALKRAVQHQRTQSEKIKRVRQLANFEKKRGKSISLTDD